MCAREGPEAEGVSARHERFRHAEGKTYVLREYLVDMRVERDALPVRGRHEAAPVAARMVGADSGEARTHGTGGARAHLVFWKASWRSTSVLLCWELP